MKYTTDEYVALAEQYKWLPTQVDEQPDKVITELLRSVRRARALAMRQVPSLDIAIFSASERGQDEHA